MKKFLSIFVGLAFIAIAIQAIPYEVKTATMAANATSVSVTNTSGSIQLALEDVYGLVSTNYLVASSCTISKVVGSDLIVVDSGTIASNTVNLEINTTGVVALAPSDVLTLTRSSDAVTGAVMAVEFVFTPKP